MTRIPYDFLDYHNIARTIVQALLEADLQVLPPAERFEGAGLYAIYYGGDFAAYRALTSPPWTKPIYVGSALPTGGRKGGALGERPGKDNSLHRRLTDHSKSIRAAGNLRLDHFRSRHLVFLPVWVRLAERFLIEKFRPVWNLHIEGFGVHDPGSTRHSGALPEWDILHPCRTWGRKMTARRSPEEVLAKLATVWTPPS